MLRRIGKTAFVAPGEIAALDVYDSGEPPRPELKRERGALVTLKSGRPLILLDVTPEEVFREINGNNAARGHLALGIATLEDKLANLKAFAQETSNRVDRLEDLESLVPEGALSAMGSAKQWGGLAAERARLRPLLERLMRELTAFEFEPRDEQLLDDLRRELGLEG